jgi:MFS family permease
VLRTSRYWTICGAFALGLCAQVGMLTHLVAYLSPMLGTAGVAAALSVTTIGAVAGRFPMGLLVDWMDRRLAACLNFLVQVVGLALLWAAPSPAAIYAGCALFGLGVGNVVSLPGLLVQREFTTAQFATTVSLIAATNQVTFAFAPGAMGLLRDGTGSYGVALGLCVALDLVAAGTILLGRPRRRAVSGQRVAKPAPPEEKAAVTNA